jgi:hypothetical protein
MYDTLAVSTGAKVMRFEPVIHIHEYQYLREIAENAEEAWPSRPADEAESEGTEGSVSPEEMASFCLARRAVTR